jgi:uncharacterized protein
VIKVSTKGGAPVFAVRVQPRASQTGVAGHLDGALKVRLAAPPVDNQANEELIRYLSKLFDLPEQQIEIIAGQKSKHKLVRVKGISAEDCEKALRKGMRDEG